MVSPIVGTVRPNCARQLPWSETWRFVNSSAPVSLDDLVAHPEKVRELAPAVRASLLIALVMAACEPPSNSTDIDIISTKALSERWGIDEARIRSWCRAGKIPGARKIDKGWIVSVAALKAWVPKAPCDDVSTMLTSPHDTSRDPQTPTEVKPYAVAIRRKVGNPQNHPVEMGERRSPVRDGGEAS